MGIGMLGILMYGVDDTTDTLWLEEPKTKRVYGVVPMELRGGNMDMNGMPLEGFPPIPLDDEIVV